jgi:hypothetical protein
MALPLFLAGCIGVLPMPQCCNQPVNGTKLQARETAFIRVGTTSAAQLFGTLGTNCICDLRQRAVAYTWELPGGNGLWWFLCLQGGTSGEFEWSRWRAFLVAFDTNNVVIAANTKHLSSRKSLDEHLGIWAEKHHAAPDHIHPANYITKD